MPNHSILLLNAIWPIMIHTFASETFAISNTKDETAISRYLNTMSAVVDIAPMPSGAKNTQELWLGFHLVGLPEIKSDMPQNQSGELPKVLGMPSLGAAKFFRENEELHFGTQLWTKFLLTWQYA